ncbi:helix-turn-helix domain-containing protein [Mesorhizobium sp. ORS 3428]|uniref:helix-turn-helix domain-containing protein n=1 Tax=Mesorhizobium sp. ORS 3428 TaxID=540997 RepID=UPI0008DB21F1|nr:helix-turn-helix domain-containing protein [Mesorhizobium sp. ORS 3428]OHV86693.1 hypothetical protein ORS3428_22995 [Mesorhizobium sp. ORS 3428]
MGLTRTGVFNIFRRFGEQGLAGLASGPQGPARPGTRRFLDAEQESISIRYDKTDQNFSAVIHPAAKP